MRVGVRSASFGNGESSYQSRSSSSSYQNPRPCATLTEPSRTAMALPLGLHEGERRHNGVPATGLPAGPRRIANPVFGPWTAPSHPSTAAFQTPSSGRGWTAPGGRSSGGGRRPIAVWLRVGFRSCGLPLAPPGHNVHRIGAYVRWHIKGDMGRIRPIRRHPVASYVAGQNLWDQLPGMTLQAPRGGSFRRMQASVKILA